MTAIQYYLQQVKDLLPTGTKVELERWAPGDGRARYRLNVNGYECGPYLMGRAAMVDALQVMAATLYRSKV